jgi:hypothetical protein
VIGWGGRLMLTVVGEAEPLGDENEGQCELKRERADVDCARQGGRGGKDDADCNYKRFMFVLVVGEPTKETRSTQKTRVNNSARL